MTLSDAVSAIRGVAGAYINTIKSKAETTGNTNIYVLAGVSPDSPPGTAPAPNAPTQFTASVNPSGSLTIKWKASQPVGLQNVNYIVKRRVNATSGPYTIISMEGRNKSFTDDGLPVGVDRVEYIVQPKRGTVVGPESALFAVQFGSVPDGGMVISSAQTAAMPMKMAA